MRERVHERNVDLVAEDGTRYDRCYVHAEPQRGGTWAGRIEFQTADGAQSLLGPRETTQSNEEGVAYWATGLQPTYLEGALHRARRSLPDSEEADWDAEFEPPEPAAAAEPAVGVPVFLRTSDPEAPFRFMKTRTLVPGVRRYIHNGGVIIYQGADEPGANGTPVAYEFLVHFGSANAAAIMANRLWNDLHGQGVLLEIDGRDTTIQNAAIKDALLSAVARR
jgi:hypothetical protein